MRLLVLTALVTAPALAAAEAPPGISHFTLDNGMEAVVIEDHRAPVVVQMVWYKVGSADEQAGKTGLAHYLEHLMFKGTETMAPGELSRTVTANGGMDNAFTSYDYTAYFQRIAADRLDLVMRMEADRMANLRIGEEDWQAERQVVLEERAQRTDSDPAALFAEERNAVQFLNHPYGKPVIGWRAEMEGLTRTDALDWYDAHYAPNNAILILAGDVTPERARELAEEYYGPIPAKEGVARTARPQEPQQRAPRRMVMHDDRVPQPRLTRSVLVPERNPGDQKTAAALTVLAELLGGSPQTSVLGQGLVMTGTALFAGTGYDGYAVDPTSFYISVVPADGVPPEEAEAELDRVLAAFRAEGPDPAQLERIKTRIRASRVYQQDSAHGRAYEYGQGLATGLGIEDIAAWPDLLAAVTADDVMAAADLVLDSTATVTGWLMPADEGAGRETAGLPAIMTEADGAAAGTGDADAEDPGPRAVPEVTEAPADMTPATDTIPVHVPPVDTLPAEAMSHPPAPPGAGTAALAPADSGADKDPAPAGDPAASGGAAAGSVTAPAVAVTRPPARPPVAGTGPVTGGATQGQAADTAATGNDTPSDTPEAGE